MAIVVQKENYELFHHRMDDVYRFRHQYFVDGMGWTQIARSNGLEKDQFDDDETVHIIEYRADGSVEAYARLLQTTRPHLLTHVYPQILQGAPAPIGPTIWELSRCAFPPSKRTHNKSTDPAIRSILLSTIETCLWLGVTGLVMEGRRASLNRLMQLGWDITPLSLPVIYNDIEMLAFYVAIDGDILANTRTSLGIHYETVDFERSFPHMHMLKKAG